MISVRHLAENFHSFWGEVLPLLTPAFVRLFNEAYENEMVDEMGVSLRSVPVSIGSVRHDIIAEVTFHVARIAYERSISSIVAIGDDSVRNLAITSVTAEMRQYGRKLVAYDLELNEMEWEEIQWLCFNYERFLTIFQNSGQVEFSPPIPGAGFLGACQADLSIGATLFEIKTVTRNIAGKDLRQLIIYLALQSSSGNRRWKEAGFFNPRKAVYFLFPVDQTISMISGGKAPAEVFREIIDFVTSRDIQIDTVF